MKKTTPHKLSERIARYGALSLAISGISNVDGQIVHHEINPVHDDETPYFLNLNPMDGTTPDPINLEDNIDDFRIFRQGTVPSSGGVNIQILSGGVEILGASATFVYPFALNSNYTVSAGNANWRNTQNQFLAYVSCNYGSSNWCGAIDKFLGLKFEINGNTHYGWAKLEVSASGWEWSVKEYAFEATADTAILTGDNGLGINDTSLENKVGVTVKDKIISLSNLPQETTLRLYNISGQEVLSTKTNSSKDQINAQKVSDGIYILNLEDNLNGNSFSKKLVLKN